MGTIRVTDEIYKKIRKISYEQGDSMGMTINKLVDNLECSKKSEDKLIKKNDNFTQNKKRYLLSLDENLFNELKLRAKETYTSLNKYINIILNNSVYEEKKFTNKELEELHNSNYQLVAIGRNLNQITKKMNAGVDKTIEFVYLSELIDTINKHINIVGKVLLDE